ncbi:MAG: hypothetical protein KJ576_21010 [Proteobacteria bacterium]|nr:hypothetical protein [Pseudomonadota bacterium]
MADPINTPGGNAPPGAGAPDGGTGDPGQNQGGEKTFTQADVDRIVKERIDRTKATTSKAQDALIAQLKDLETRASTTAEEKAALQAQIRTMEEATMSEKEIAARRLKDAENSRQREVAEANEKATSWESRFKDGAVKRSLSDAAAKFNAFDPSQIVGLLAGTAEVEALKDDMGKETGEYAVFVRVMVDGKPERLPAAEGVEKFMSANPNLIKANVQGGSGSQGSVNAEGKKIFKRTQVADYTFYQENKAEILLAQAEGRIVEG